MMMRLIRPVVLFFLCAVCTSAMAATIVTAKGQVRVLRGGAALEAKAGLALRDGDQLVADDASEAIIEFDEGGRLALRPSSTIVLSELPRPESTPAMFKVVRLVLGRVRYASGNKPGGTRVNFQTDAATVGVRGTDLEIAVTGVAVGSDPPGTFVKVTEGVAYIRATDGSTIDVLPGQVGYGGGADVTRGLAPAPGHSPETPRAFSWSPSAAPRPVIQPRLAGALAVALFAPGSLDSALNSK